MLYCKTDLYDGFSCIAGDCPDTCCAGWQIVIDEESLERYEAVPGDFGRRLRASIDDEEGIFCQSEDRRCAFLNDQDLCDIYATIGEAYLCETCRRYPRHIEEFDGIREMSLSLSCPEAARMLFEAEDVPRLVSFETDEEETTFEEDEMDFLLFTRLSDAREVMFSLIYAESVPVDLMLKIIEDFGEDLQSCIDEEREYEMDEVIDGYREKVAQCIKHYGTVDKGAGFSERLWIDQRDADGSRTDSGKSGNLWTDDDAGRDDLNDRTSGPGRFESRMEEFRVLTSLELLRPEWGELLLDVLDRLYSEGEEAYLEKVETFERTWGSRAEDPFVRNRWSLICRKLMFFFIHTYFCGAVYDAWPAAKTRMAAFSVRWIMELLMYRFHANGGVLTDRDVIEMAWRYAREVEHSDQNLDILDEALDRAKEET